ncbi:hypothetical protein V1521DRAFT_434460 [Lipomyces starkeyi]
MVYLGSKALNDRLWRTVRRRQKHGEEEGNHQFKPGCESISICSKVKLGNNYRFLSCFCRNLVGFPLLDWWGFILFLVRFLIVILLHILLVCFFFFFISIFSLLLLAIGFDSLFLLFLFLANFFFFFFLFLFLFFLLLLFFILRRSRVSILVLFFLLFLIGRESLKLLFRITASSRHFY